MAHLQWRPTRYPRRPAGRDLSPAGSQQGLLVAEGVPAVWFNVGFGR
jgi:hypothetical protein